MPSFRHPVTAKFPLAQWIYWGGLFTATVSAALFMIFMAAHPDIRIGADSATYWTVANAIRKGSSNAVLLSFGMNLFGPVALALALKSTILIALLNYGLYLLSIRTARTLGFDFRLFALLLVLNPETLPSVVTLNKEVLGMFGFVLLIRYEYDVGRPKLLLLLALIVGMMARWEQAAISLIFVMLRRGAFRRHPWLSLLMVAVGISVTWPIMMSHVDLSGFTAEAAGAGLILILDKIQNHGGFLLVMFPKMLVQTFGHLIEPWYFLGDFWHQDFTDWQNQIFINLHTVAMLFLVGWFIIRRQYDIREPIPFLVALYLLVTTTSTFVMPRYGYPVYTLLAMEAARLAYLGQRHQKNEIRLVNY